MCSSCVDIGTYAGFRFFAARQVYPSVYPPSPVGAVRLCEDLAITAIRF